MIVFFVDWGLRHLLTMVLGGTALLVAVIVVAVLTPGTLFEAPTRLMGLVSAIAALANVGVLLALAGRRRRVGEDFLGKYTRVVAVMALLLALGAPLLVFFG